MSYARQESLVPKRAGGQFPKAPESLRQSAECGVAPKNRLEKLDLIDAALGELSQFHEAHGFYVHGVSLDAAALPGGWHERVTEVRNENTRQNTGLCTEAHDLAASKLVAFGDRDRSFVRVLLVERLIEPEVLLARIESLPCDAERKNRLVEWVEATIRD